MPTMDFYISRGFSREAARYFAEGKRRATSVEASDARLLRITYDNGEQRMFNMAPLIEPGTVFAFLSDGEAFRRVYLDSDHNIAWDIDPAVDSEVVWSNKVDISADTCYLEGAPA